MMFTARSYGFPYFYWPDSLAAGGLHSSWTLTPARIPKTARPLAVFFSPVA